MAGYQTSNHGIGEWRKSTAQRQTVADVYIAFKLRGYLLGTIFEKVKLMDVAQFSDFAAAQTYFCPTIQAHNISGVPA